MALSLSIADACHPRDIPDHRLLFSSDFFDTTNTYDEEFELPEEIVHFYGVVEWQIRDRKDALERQQTLPDPDPDEGIAGLKLQLAPDVASRNTKTRLAYIIWDEKGTLGTQSICLRILADFCSLHLGFWERQWRSCEIYHWRLWLAANKIWGYPRLELSRDWYTEDYSDDSFIINMCRYIEDLELEDSSSFAGAEDMTETLLSGEFNSYLPPRTQRVHQQTVEKHNRLVMEGV